MTDQPEAPRVIAAFDFDGTLTRRDTLVPFLRHSCGSRRTTRALLAESLRITLSLTGRSSRDLAKEALLVRLLRGLPAAELEAAAEVFADHVVARNLRPTLRDRIAWHRVRGHLLVMVSASPELVVLPVAGRLGFDAALGTRLEVGPDGRLTGRLEGANCRGPEKAARLTAWMGKGAVLAYAYGDSAGDRELLALARTPVWVTRRALPSLME